MAHEVRVDDLEVKQWIQSLLQRKRTGRCHKHDWGVDWKRVQLYIKEWEQRWLEEGGKGQQPQGQKEWDSEERNGGGGRVWCRLR